MMKWVNRLLIGVSLLVIIVSAILLVKMSTTNMDLTNQTETLTNSETDYKESTQGVKKTKRPKVTAATTTLNQFFSSMYDFDNQNEFDQRKNQAEKCATIKAIDESGMFETDKAKLVSQLKQTSKLEKVEFYPKAVSASQVSGRVLVDNATTQKDDDRTAESSVQTGFDVILDTSANKVISVKYLGVYTLQADSGVLSNTD